MELRKTPHIYDEARSAYEQAYKTGSHYRLASIELDTLIDSGFAVALTHPEHVAEIGHIIELESQAVLEAFSKKANADETFTDLNRATTTASFSVERFMAPLIYGVQDESMSKVRRLLADGIEGRSIDFIEQYLSVLHSDRQISSEEVQNIRGAIQEHTVMALLNAAQSGNRLALPASLIDDERHGTDIYLYRYDYKQGAAYRHPISVKSTNAQKDEELGKYPNSIVVTASSFGNLDLSISQLLVRENEGAPGLTERERSQLQVAVDNVVNQVANRLHSRRPTTLDAERLPNIKIDGLASLLKTVA